MTKRLILILGIFIALPAAIKFSVRSIYGGSRTADKVYFPPTNEPRHFVFSGVEVALPWEQIDGIYSFGSMVVFYANGDQRFAIQRLSTDKETAEKLKKLNLPTEGLYSRLKTKVEHVFLGDLDKLVMHPERIDQLNIPLPNRVTWTSNPISDARKAIGMLVLRWYGRISTNEVENSMMRGYHDEFYMDQSTNSHHAYSLGMKDGTGGVSVMLLKGSASFLPPLLGSVRLVNVSQNTSRFAFQESKRLSHSLGASRPIEPYLWAVEAASNGTPNLEYVIQVLDLSRANPMAAPRRAWLGYALHQFPESRSKLRARYPEFASLMK